VQVLKQMARGLANKEIGEVLKITEYTVKDHLKNILGKLHVADRTEAVTVALQRGIIDLDGGLGLKLTGEPRNNWTESALAALSMV